LFQLALRNAGQELTVPKEERPARDVLIRDISGYLLDCDPESATMKQMLAERSRTSGRPKLVRRVADALFAKFERIREQRPKAPEPNDQDLSPKDKASPKDQAPGANDQIPKPNDQPRTKSEAGRPE
jgi:hypothetical protein